MMALLALDVLWHGVYTAPVPVLMTWTVERDVLGRWCVVRTQGWFCMVYPTAPLLREDRAVEDRARALAACLNRAYDRCPSCFASAPQSALCQYSPCPMR